MFIKQLHAWQERYQRQSHISCFFCDERWEEWKALMWFRDWGISVWMESFTRWKLTLMHSVFMAHFLSSFNIYHRAPTSSSQTNYKRNFSRFVRMETFSSTGGTFQRAEQQQQRKKARKVSWCWDGTDERGKKILRPIYLSDFPSLLCLFFVFFIIQDARADHTRRSVSHVHMRVINSANLHAKASAWCNNSNLSLWLPGPDSHTSRRAFNVAR